MCVCVHSGIELNLPVPPFWVRLELACSCDYLPLGNFCELFFLCDVCATFVSKRCDILWWSPLVNRTQKSKTELKDNTVVTKHVLNFFAESIFSFSVHE